MMQEGAPGAEVKREKHEDAHEAEGSTRTPTRQRRSHKRELDGIGGIITCQIHDIVSNIEVCIIKTHTAIVIGLPSSAFFPSSYSS